MVRLPFHLLVLTFLVAGVVVAARAGTQQRGDDKQFVDKFRKTFYEALRVQESKPVTMKDAQFVVVAQTEWQPGEPNRTFPIVVPIDLQLRITNLREGEVLFPTDRTFGVRIFKGDGAEVKPRAGGTRATATGPVLLPGGAAYSLCRRAELRLIEYSKASELVYHDGTGAHAVFGPLDPGPYRLAFWYAVTAEQGKQAKGGPGAVWVGEVVAKEVPFRILDGTRRGVAAEVWKFPEPSAAMVRVVQSKPATVNDARFVAVAARDWKPGKGNVPVDVQLHITNLSKGDLLFHTFDTFDVYLKDGQGKPVMLTAGARSATTMTPPLVLPAGATYALCRKAELQGKAKAACEFFYGEGTSNELGFGPLRPGRYQLGFGYSVARTAPLKDLVRPETKKGEPATWLGTSVTEPVLVEVHPRD